jgi:hypothetical protein
MIPAIELQLFPEIETITIPTAESYNSLAIHLKPQADAVKILDTMFPEQKRQDRDVAKAKELLGDLVEGLSDTQIKEMVTDANFLITTWLDDFERSIFDGQTLREVLHEGEHT